MPNDIWTENSLDIFLLGTSKLAGSNLAGFRVCLSPFQCTLAFFQEFFQGAKSIVMANFSIVFGANFRGGQKS